MQPLNISKLVRFRICAGFIKNPALSISTCFLAKNLVFPKIKVSFVYIPIILISGLFINVISKHKLYVEVFICKFFT